jgi:hypothetical protein
VPSDNPLDYNWMLYGVKNIGKAQPLTSKVLTPVGFKLMGDIKVGDLVVGSNGKPCPVIGVYPQGSLQTFRVVFNDGSATECSDDHLWFVQDFSDRRAGRRGAVRPLSEIRMFLKYGTHANYAIPQVAPVEFATACTELPLHPWLLGVYLGDGTSGQGENVVIHNSKPDIQERVGKFLPKSDTSQVFDGDTIRVRRKTRTSDPSDFKQRLVQLGLCGLRASEKFIPGEYLTAPVNDRIALLQGLMDTDGSVADCRTTMEYCTTSQKLAEGLTFLVRSLGGSATRVGKKSPKYTYRGEHRTGKPAVRLFVHFPRNSSVVPVSSKKHLAKWKGGSQTLFTIKEVIPLGVQDCQCIRIYSPDSLYVTDDFVLTHNTCLSAMFDDVSAHFLAEPGRRDVATPIIPRKGEVPLTWSRFKSYLELLLEQSPGRAVLDTVDSIAKLCEQHHAKLSNVETLMAMTDNGRAWRQMMDDWHNTWNAILWSGWRITVLSHVRVRDKVRRDIARDDLKKGGKAKEAGIVVAETQPSCSGWAYEWTKEVCSIVGCFTYRRRDRYLYIRGHEEMYASPGGGGVGERHFLDPKTEEPYDAVYMGTSPSQAWINLQAAWNNEVEGLKVSEDNFYKEAGE